MKKLNLICASIAVLCASAASAGTLTTAVPNGTLFAVENFGGSTSASTDAIVPGAITYSMTNITAVNSGATVYFTVRLTGGKFAAAPAFSTFSFAGLACGNGFAAAAVGTPGCVVALSADKTTVLVSVRTAESYTLGLGAFTYTPAAGNIDSVNTSLAAAEGTVSATVGLTTSAPASYEFADAQGTVDAPLASAVIAKAKTAITGTVEATSSTVKIDLTAAGGAGTAFTAGANGKAVLGDVRFKDASGTQNVRAGNADYTLANNNGGANTGVVVTVTPGTGEKFPEGSSFVLNSAVDCAGGTDLATTVAPAGNVTAANASTARTLTTTVAVAHDTPVFVCLGAPGAGKTATPLQATLSATVTPQTTKDLIASVTGTGYALAYNGSSVDVLTYWPGKLDAYNYKGYLRITNTGSVPANVSLAHVGVDDGVIGTAKVIIAALLPGQSKLMSTKDIDAIVGANPSNLESGRARVTAPTNGLRVQSLLQTGDDAPIEYRANNGN